MAKVCNWSNVGVSQHFRDYFRENIRVVQSTRENPQSGESHIEVATEFFAVKKLGQRLVVLDEMHKATPNGETALASARQQGSTVLAMAAYDSHASFWDCGCGCCYGCWNLTRLWEITIFMGKSTFCTTNRLFSRVVLPRLRVHVLVAGARGHLCHTAGGLRLRLHQAPATWPPAGYPLVMSKIAIEHGSFSIL